MPKNKFNVDKNMWDDLSSSKQEELNRRIESCVQDEKSGDGRSESKAVAVCKDNIVKDFVTAKTLEKS